MKKFISMVMAAAMVVSLVPATAFAAGDVSATAKIVDALDWTEDEAKESKIGDQKGYISWDGAPELQITVDDADYQKTDGDNVTMDVTLTFDGAELKKGVTPWDLMGLIKIDYKEKGKNDDFVGTAKRGADTDGNVDAGAVVILKDDVEDDEFTFTIVGKLAEDDVISVDLESVMTKTSEGATASVSVDSKMVEADDLVYASILGQILKVKVKDTVDVAEEEYVVLEKFTVSAATGNLPTAAKDGQDIKLKLNTGFEFDDKAKWTIDAGKNANAKVIFDEDDDNVAYLNVDGTTDEITIKGIKIEAATAKEGAVATIKVSATDWDAASVEVATVVGEGLTISVDEDEDVPVMWSGVAKDTVYLTDDDDNTALAFTIKESVAGAYNKKDEVELVLPEGVWVVGAKDGVKVSEEAGKYDGAGNAWDGLFAKAYKETDHTSFLFEKREIAETDVEQGEGFEIEVELELVADPGFVGDVTVEMLVDGESVGEVVIATFKAPYTVEAQANDLIIDYRNTEVPTNIVVKEAEAGLWAKGLVLGFGIDRFEKDPFEDDMVYTVNKESGMEIDGEDKALEFEVEEESDDEAAEIVISNISLYMQRNIPAGAYDLTIHGNVFGEYKDQILFAPDCEYNCKKDEKNVPYCNDEDHEYKVKDVEDYSDVVKEGFINVITAGRDKDDASFTTKVVVPVGEMYIVAGEQTVALDVPAYVSASGYTMLPVRAVAVALGILNNNVLWDQTTKTVTILYGQRIITMTVGAKVINVNGSAIPASSSPEVVNGRTFLPMRDLATALGVTDITWDAATKTATLNGNK